MNALPTPIQEPIHLPTSNWLSIQYHDGQLLSSLENNDLRSAFGHAKDLLEAFCRIVIHIHYYEKKEVSDFRRMVNKTEKILRDLHWDNDIVKALHRLTTPVVIEIGSVRNKYGIGHGKIELSAIPIELATLPSKVQKWVLEGLQIFDHSLLDKNNEPINNLISDLARESYPFPRGHLFERLIEISPILPPERAHELGQSIGNRWSYDTNTVIDEGLKVISFNRFPPELCFGIIEGSFFDARKNFRICPRAIQSALQLLNNFKVDDINRVLTTILRQVYEAEDRSTYYDCTYRNRRIYKTDFINLPEDIRQFPDKNEKDFDDTTKNKFAELALVIHTTCIPFLQTHRASRLPYSPVAPEIIDVLASPTSFSPLHW